MTVPVDLDAQVRASDPDRWASSRFVADTARRADLITLYALEAELMTIPARVTQPTLAEMRYAWWSDQLNDVFSGEPRKGHPVLEALAAAVLARGLERPPFDALIEAHIARVHDEPHDLDAFFVGPMSVAARILAGPGLDDLVTSTGRVWGLTQTGRFDEAQALRPAANRDLADLPPRAFPAVAHAALRDRDEPDFARRLGLTWATLRGRI